MFKKKKFWFFWEFFPQIFTLDLFIKVTWAIFGVGVTNFWLNQWRKQRLKIGTVREDLPWCLLCSMSNALGNIAALKIKELSENWIPCIVRRLNLLGTRGKWTLWYHCSISSKDESWSLTKYSIALGKLAFNWHLNFFLSPGKQAQVSLVENLAKTTLFFKWIQEISQNNLIVDAEYRIQNMHFKPQIWKPLIVVDVPQHTSCPTGNVLALRTPSSNQCNCSSSSVLFWCKCHTTIYFFFQCSEMIQENRESKNRVYQSLTQI